MKLQTVSGKTYYANVRKSAFRMNLQKKSFEEIKQNRQDLLMSVEDVLKYLTYHNNDSLF